MKALFYSSYILIVNVLLTILPHIKRLIFLFLQYVHRALLQRLMLITKTKFNT